jgi:hypothetical protein
MIVIGHVALMVLARMAKKIHVLIIVIMLIIENSAKNLSYGSPGHKPTEDLAERNSNLSYQLLTVKVAQFILQDLLLSIIIILERPYLFIRNILTPTVEFNNHHFILEFQRKWYLSHLDSVTSGGKISLRCINIVELLFNYKGTTKTINSRSL